MTGIVLAYDRSTFDPEDRALLEQIVPGVDMTKIGLEALTAHKPNQPSVGNQIHAFVRATGRPTLLDWKLNDIGTTMANATRNIAGVAAAMTVHGSTAEVSLAKVVEARNERAQATGVHTFLLGVTVLTDIETEECVSIFGNKRPEKVCWLADRLLTLGFDGFVCSGRELEELEKRKIRKHALTLVPGTRPSWASNDDQKNVMTYQEVAELGATWTVVGRVVMKAQDPIETLARVRAELGDR